MMLELYLTSFTICLLLTLLLHHRHFENTSRKRIVRRVLGLVSTMLLTGMLLTPTYATTISEYTIPGNPGLWDISPSNATSPSITADTLWFTESGANNIGVLRYNDTVVKEFSVPTLNSQPWGITYVNWPNVAAVFTESYGNKIGIMAANLSRIAEYAVPTSGSGPRKIAFDAYRNCTWFTEYAYGTIGQFRFSWPTPNAWRASITEYKLQGGSNPIGIAVDPIGPKATTRYIWVADFGRKSIVRFYPEDGTFREYSVYPFSPWDVALDADGMVWFTGQRPGTDENIIGQLNPVRSEKESAAQSRWALTIIRVPTPNSEVHEIEVDSQGTVWFTEFSDYASKIGRYRPFRNEFAEYSIITPVAKPQGLAITESSGIVNVWFTEYGGRRIGRLRQPEGPTVSTTVYVFSSIVTTSSTVLAVTTSPPIVPAINTVVATTLMPTSTTTVASTTSSTLVDTVSVIRTSPTYWTYTYTFTTSTSFTTTTTTYRLTVASVESTSTTTSVTATYVSTTWEGITLLTTLTVQSLSLFTVSTSTTATVTQVSTIYSPTVTVPTTTATGALTTIYSPTVTQTSIVSTATTTTTTSSATTTTTSVSPTMTLTTTATATSVFMPLRPCIIASAAYGSELAPEVQLLRNFREQNVLSTFAGSNFMKVFNQFYYSFSPAIAPTVASTQAVATPVRVLLYPLVGILQVSSAIFNAAGFAPELGVILAGIFSSALLGAVYLTPVMFGIGYMRKRMKVDRLKTLSSLRRCPEL
jgi:streptogramin lyase